MNTGSDIGHLVTIMDMITNARVFIFLYITGDEPPYAYEKVIKGIRGLSLPLKMRKTTAIQADPVPDFSRIAYEHPETTGHQINKLPVTAFFDTKRKTFKDKLFLSSVINVIEKGGALFPGNRPGAVVTGSDFFDREEVINKIWEDVKAGRNVLICGPRRYGKTSIMRGMAEMAAKHGFRPVMIDLESLYSPQEFVARVWTEIEGPDEAEGKKDKKAEKLKEKLEDRWISEGTQFFKTVSGRKEKLLFLLDECPYMLDSFLGKDVSDGMEKISPEDRKRTNDFVEWFKEQRKQSAKRCAFILAGSINLKPYLQDNGLNQDAFSDCREVRLRFFDPETVRTYVESLLLGEGMFVSDEVIKGIVALTTPGVPFFIQIMMIHVKALFRRDPKFSVEDLKKVYREKVIGPDGRRMFDTFERHFNRYGARKPGAKAILKELAGAGVQGRKRDDLERIYEASSQLSGKKEFDIILKYLEYDFYVEKIKGTTRYRFASPILRDYWRKNQYK